MAVDVFVTCCCWVAVDCEMGTPSLVQVTVVAGPPEETQVRVLDAKLCSIGELITGAPEITMHSFDFINCNLVYLSYFHKSQQSGSHFYYLVQ